MTRAPRAVLLAMLLAVLAAAVLALTAARAGPLGGEPGGQVPEPGAQAAAVSGLPPCGPPLAVDMPDVALPCYGGGPDVRLSGAPGRPMLVNLWATWCGPCVDEVPTLVQFAQRAGTRVGVVGVVYQDSPDSVYAFARTFQIRYPLLRDDNGLVLRRHGAAPPRTLLVAADGRIVHTKVGAFRDLQDVEDTVAEHLGVRL